MLVAGSTIPIWPSDCLHTHIKGIQFRCVVLNFISVISLSFSQPCIGATANARPTLPPAAALPSKCMTGKTQGGCYSVCEGGLC